MNENLYHYRALITDVYDGDTCTANIDLGLNTWIHGEKLRLYRINAPELRGEERPAGLRSRDFFRALIEGKEVTIQTIKDRKEKYGRYLAEIWFKDETGIWQNVNDLMVSNGHAHYQDYE
ncbi:MAG TPA: thermonuclease family protein [Anaerolineales bacterium]|nr:thermonuclease family protein [Anaerolineales bacterium]